MEGGYDEGENPNNTHTGAHAKEKIKQSALEIRGDKRIYIKADREREKPPAGRKGSRRRIEDEA